MTILVVDDYFDFRRFLSFLLSTYPDLQIIGEAGDGREAVRLAAELKPSLILLDIGLPVQNGIEAARKIRSESPRSKILFVTLVESADMIEEAFAAGAHGYVFKSRVVAELLPAIRAVMTGKIYLTRPRAGLEPN